jgi:macrophage erythroblast attacher
MIGLHSQDKQDEPLLRFPLELLKNNLKIAQQHCDKTAKKVNELIGKGAKIYAEAGDDDVAEADAALISHIDQALNSLYALQKKLTALNESNNTLHKKTKSRITHLAELHKIPSLADVKYEEWSRVRLDRLLVDTMLRQGFFESAKQLAEEKGITDLVDIEVFEAVGRIEKSLRVDKRVDLALAWCAENRSNLKKLQQDVSQRMLAYEDVSIDEFWQANLEFELRLQQFIEMVRTGDTDKLLEAIKHAHKYLTPQEHIKGGITAAGLLAYTEDTDVEPYKVSEPGASLHIHVLTT